MSFKGAGNNKDSDQKQKKPVISNTDQDNTAYCELPSSQRCTLSEDQAEGACACPRGSDETNVKSLSLVDELTNAPDLTVDACARGSDISLNRNYPSRDPSPGSNSKTVDNSNISLLDATSRTESAAEAHAKEQSTVEADLGNLPMNIPPSLTRFNNREVSVGLAEQQPSFRTTETVSSGFPALSQLRQTPANNVAILRSSRNDDLGACKGTGKYNDDPYPSVEENISVSSDLQDSLGTARPVQPEDTRQQQPNSPVNGAAGGVGHNGSRPGMSGHQLSHSSSVISQSSIIPDNCPIRKLPRRIINLVADHLQCGFSGTWKDLVEIHGWNYERTYLFEHRPHRDGIFCALLHEAEFQRYTLDQLKNDLRNIPRLDLLTDLEELIEEHNSRAFMGRST